MKIIFVKDVLTGHESPDLELKLGGIIGPRYLLHGCDKENNSVIHFEITKQELLHILNGVI